MATSVKPKKLCQDSRGRYLRTLGKFINASGKLAPKKFLLGTERHAAELANLRLEQLWRLIVQETGHRNQRMSFDDEPEEPQWTEQSLWIAEAIRKGEQQIVVPLPVDQEVSDTTYVSQVNWLNEKYGKVMSFVPAQADAFKRGQERFAEIAADRARQAAHAASIAEVQIPTAAGQSLFQALEAYADWVRRNKRSGEQTSAWGHRLAESVLRLKNSHRDVPLEQLNYNAVERIKEYWAARPLARNTNKAISRHTVVNQLKALRLFLKWLHKNPDFKWRKPPDVEDAWACNIDQLMTDEEIASLKNGVSTFSIEDLRLLYRHATDRMRVLILLGLNGGFSHAECQSLRKDEVLLDHDPPVVKRVRRKNRVYHEWALWPETQRALEWIARERAGAEPPGNELVVLTETGKPLPRQGIANRWVGLLNRIKQAHPNFSALSFKHLRKTAAQLVRNVSDGETAGVFLAHGQAVRSDHLADVYSNRDFARVFEANRRVHEFLSPMFAEAADAFTQPRRKGGPNIGRQKVQRIHALAAGGASPVDIERAVGVSRTTVDRHLQARRG